MPPDNRRKVPNIRLVDGEKIDNLPDDTQGNITQVQSNLTSHEANTSNPHSVTKAQVGLDFVTNTGSPSEALFGDGVYRVPLGEGDVTLNDIQTLTNKTITDYTNTVYARALTFHIKATGTINKGQPIRVTGYNSGEDAFEVTLANQTTGVANGVSLQNLTIGQFGLMLSDGVIEGINTSSFTEGTILYLDGTGAFQSTVPATGYIQQLAYVLRSHAVNGALQIKAQSPLQRVGDIPGLQTSLDGKANLSGGNPFSGLNIFSNNDTFFGDQTKNWVNIGNLGTSDNTYIDTQGVNTNVPLIIRTKGSGAVSIEADTYIDSPTFAVNGQNWTSAWTSYTPAVSFGTSTGVFVVFARYKQMGKTCVGGFQINIATPDTSIYFGTISLPVVGPYNIAAGNISVFEGSNYINCTSQIDGTIFTAIKIGGNFSGGFLVIRGSFTYETN